jgi:hypothetical protein
VGGLHVALERQQEGGAIAHISLLDTIPLTVIQQALPPVDPPAATAQFALVQENEGQPEGATGGAGHLTGLHVLVVRTRPCVDAVVDPANEVRSRREPLQILELQMRVTLRDRQLRERVPPRPPSKRLTTSIDRVGHGHSLVHSAFCSPDGATRAWQRVIDSDHAGDDTVAAVALGLAAIAALRGALGVGALTGPGRIPFRCGVAIAVLDVTLLLLMGQA